MESMFPPELIKEIQASLDESRKKEGRAIEEHVETGKRFRDIIDRIEYRPEWRKVLKQDGNRYYFCFEWDDVCNFTGKSMVSRSAKYYLSPHMTQTEIVNLVFLAAVKAEEHETRERFRYKPHAEAEWRAPYNTHVDIDCLYDIACDFDVR